MGIFPFSAATAILALVACCTLATANDEFTCTNNEQIKLASSFNTVEFLEGFLTFYPNFYPNRGFVEIPKFMGIAETNDFGTGKDLSFYNVSQYNVSASTVNDLESFKENYGTLCTDVGNSDNDRCKTSYRYWNMCVHFSDDDNSSDFGQLILGTNSDNGVLIQNSTACFNKDTDAMHYFFSHFNLLTCCANNYEVATFKCNTNNNLVHPICGSSEFEWRLQKKNENNPRESAFFNESRLANPDFKLVCIARETTTTTISTSSFEDPSTSTSISTAAPSTSSSTGVEISTSSLATTSTPPPPAPPPATTPPSPVYRRRKSVPEQPDLCQIVRDYNMPGTFPYPYCDESACYSTNDPQLNLTDCSQSLPSTPSSTLMTTDTTAAQPPTTPPPTPPPPRASRPSEDAVIGIAVGSGVGGVLLVSGLAYYIRSRG